MDFLQLLYVLYVNFYHDHDLTGKLQSFTEFQEKLSQQLQMGEVTKISRRVKPAITFLDERGSAIETLGPSVNKREIPDKAKTLVFRMNPTT